MMKTLQIYCLTTGKGSGFKKGSKWVQVNLQGIGFTHSLYIGSEPYEP
jgi:hypothetical protein